MMPGKDKTIGDERETERKTDELKDKQTQTNDDPYHWCLHHQTSP
jgi:hypothetical protein